VPFVWKNMAFSSLTANDILKALVCHQIVNTRSQKQGKLDKIATAKCKHNDATIFIYLLVKAIKSKVVYYQG